MIRVIALYQNGKFTLPLQVRDPDINKRAERRLRTALRTLLLAEGIIKLVLRIKMSIDEKGKALQLCCIAIIHSMIRTVFVGQLAANVTSCGNSSSPPAYVFIVDWCVSKVQRVINPDLAIVGRTLPLAFGVILLGLALYKSVEYWKQVGVDGSRLILVLIKDQIFYFAL